MRRPLVILVGVIIVLLIFTSPLTFLLPFPAVTGAVPNEPKDVEAGTTVKDEIVSSQPLESQSGIALTFRALSISPSDRQMTGEITAALNEAAKRTLRDYKNESLVTCPTNDKPCRLSIGPNQPTPTLVVGADTSTATFERSISLIDLFQYNLQVPLIAFDSVTIPLRGLPTYYPSDSYAVTLSLHVRSDDVQVPSIQSYTFGSDRMSDMNSSIRRVSLVAARFAFTRLLLTQVFVYGIAYVLPLVLLLAVVVLLYLRRSASGRPSIEAFLTIGLLAVTLLLVRPIVVPPSITVLTLPDYGLGIGVFLLILATAGAQLQRGRQPGLPSTPAAASAMTRALGRLLLAMMLVVALIRPRRGRMGRLR